MDRKSHTAIRKWVRADHQKIHANFANTLEQNTHLCSQCVDFVFPGIPCLTIGGLSKMCVPCAG